MVGGRGGRLWGHYSKTVWCAARDGQNRKRGALAWSSRELPDSVWFGCVGAAFVVTELWISVGEVWHAGFWFHARVQPLYWCC